MVAMILLVLVVTLACTAVTALCFAIALYELLNGEAEGLRLDPALALPAVVNVAIETMALAAGVLSLPWRSLSSGHRTHAPTTRAADGRGRSCSSATARAASPAAHICAGAAARLAS